MESKILNVKFRNGTNDGIIEIKNLKSNLGVSKCPRKYAKKFLNEISTFRGVYLLKSDDESFVGISFELYPQIRDSLINQLWWNNLYFVYQLDTSFTNEELYCIRDYYIKDSYDRNSYRMNLINYNFYQYNKCYKKVKQFILDTTEMLCYFNISISNVESFANNEIIKKTNTKLGNNKNEQESTHAKGEKKPGQVLRKEAKEFIINKGINVKNYNFAKLAYIENLYWVNPNVKYLDEEWKLFLYNQNLHKMYYFKIPAHTFSYDTTVKRGNRVLMRRDDPSKDNVLEIKIDPTTYIDIMSGNSFKEFFVESFDCFLELTY